MKLPSPKLSSPKFPYQQLPKDVMGEVNKYLNYEDLQNLALANKKSSQVQSEYLRSEKFITYERLRREEIKNREMLELIQKVQNFIIENPSLPLNKLLSDYSNIRDDFIVELIKQLIEQRKYFYLGELGRYKKYNVIRELLEIENLLNASVLSNLEFEIEYITKPNNKLSIELLDLIRAHPNYQAGRRL